VSAMHHSCNVSFMRCVIHAVCPTQYSGWAPHHHICGYMTHCVHMPHRVRTVPRDTRRDVLRRHARSPRIGARPGSPRIGARPGSPRIGSSESILGHSWEHALSRMSVAHTRHTAMHYGSDALSSPLLSWPPTDSSAVGGHAMACARSRTWPVIIAHMGVIQAVSVLCPISILPRLQSTRRQSRSAYIFGQELGALARSQLRADERSHHTQPGRYHAGVLSCNRPWTWARSLGHDR
jgi:hypothetical protein